MNMSTIYVNPGSGSVKDATIENAKINIQKFIEDCNLAGLKVNNYDVIDENDGRYRFILTRDGYDWSCEILMPGLPLEQVRYMEEPEQNVWNFPRLYVDRSSWIWCYALLDENDFKEEKNG